MAPSVAATNGIVEDIMLRRAALVSFALAITLVVACGRQVTPDPGLTNGNLNLSGRMVVRFRTNGPMDFTKYTYAIVVDTCGGGTPFPNAFATTFNDYSFSFLVGGIYGVAGPALFQYIITPGVANSLNPQQVPLGASTTQFLTNSNQQNSEFQLTFVRQQLNNPLQVAQPCPNITPVQSGPTASASAGTSPLASSSATPTARPTASTSPTATMTPIPMPPNSQPTTLNQRFWYFNFFTIDTQSRIVVDSLGIGGAQDTTFNGIGIAVDISENYPIFKQTGSIRPSDPAAQLAGGEIDNFQ